MAQLIILTLTSSLATCFAQAARFLARTGAGSARVLATLFWLSALVGSHAAIAASTLHEAPAPVTISRADFRQSSDAQWTQVALPDTWSLRALPGTGQGEYRVVLTLPFEPPEPWGLAFDRISPVREVYVNGELVDAHPPGGRMVPLPALVEVPLHLLHAGDNEIRLTVQYRHRGGLSSVRTGPIDALERSHERLLWWENELPQQLNMVAAVMAALMIAIAWRQPREKAIGLFGALGLISGVRNYVTLGDMLPWPGDWMDRFAFAAMVWMAMLFMAYTHRLRFHTPLRWYRFFWVFLGAVPLVVILLPSSWLPPVRIGMYASLAVVNLRSVQNVVMSARADRDLAHRALCVFLLVIFLAALHDFAYQIVGWLPITQPLALSRVLPLALCCYSGLLLVRLFDAMAQVDLLNRTLEARVVQRTRELEAANAAKTHFIASASHDLRQPLVSIGLLVNMLGHEIAKGVAGDALNGLIGRIGKAVSTMEELLKRLLDFSRLEGAGNTPVSLRSVQVQGILDAVIEHELPQADAKGLRLRIRPSPLSLLTDPVMLEQILRNLVSNAIRYTDRGGVLVGVRQHRSSGEAQICVWDTGRGIAKPDQDAIFEPFVQLNNPGRMRKEGLGLGLAIVRRAAAQLGHTVSLESESGRGSCFKVVIPLADRSRKNANLERSERSAAIDATTLRGRVIWL